MSSNFLSPYRNEIEATTIIANKLVRRSLQFQVETSRWIRSQGGLQGERSEAIYGSWNLIISKLIL